MDPYLPPELARLAPTPWTEPFWAALAEHQIVVGRCRSCQATRMPPGPFCWRCHEQPIEWIDGGSTGEVHTFTITRRAFHHSLGDHVPYVIAVVALDAVEGARLITNVVDGDPEEVRIGLQVEVVWDDIDAERTIPRFRSR